MNMKSPSSITFRTRIAALASDDPCTHPARAIALAPPTQTATPSSACAMPETISRLLALLRKYSARLLMPLLKPRKRRRKLQLLEMQQLGEKRFVAIVRVGRQKFLIGGAASSVLLLAEIGERKATVLPPHPLSQERA